jgi:cytochrome c-type biogenesis protein CcmH
MFWGILVVLCLVAVLFAVWPLWRSSHRLTPAVSTIIVLTVALSAALYNQVGSPGAPSGRSGADDSLPDMQEAVATLQGRLDRNPEDIAGWKMLGRTQMTMGNFGGAAEAYEMAMDLEDAKVAQTLVDLAVAIMNRDQTQIEGRTASLVDSALALEPNNPAALFYSGVAAANRGDTETAAERWEKLLGLNPPENIRSILVQRIAEWRGENPPAAMPTMQAPVTEQAPAAEQTVPDDAVVSARISLSEEALGAINTDASVFIIARDPAAPSPPIAVTRRMLSELPAVVSLTDAQSMVAGRNLSAFAELEILARVSLSGGPAAAAGDWFGSKLVRPAENRSITLTIDQQVP